jgi:hypothetical protein
MQRFWKQSKYLIRASAGLAITIAMFFSRIDVEHYVWAGFWFAAACGHVWIIIDEVRKINWRTR